MRSLSVWQMIDDSLEAKIAVVLLYVVESRGSSPGRRGFSMAVNEQGRMEGSIGGGIMEHKFVEMARQLLADQATSQLRKQYHDKDAARDQSGMICSGEQTIWIYPVRLADRGAVKQIIESAILHQAGELILSPIGIAFSSALPKEDFSYHYTSDSEWWYREKMGYRLQLSIIGGGHCALALSELMRKLDFYIRVFDERPGLKTMEENLWAHEKQLMADYSVMGEWIPSAANHYVVVMTFGYRTDAQVIRALKGKQLGYLGVLGSKKKITKMISDFREDGFPEEWLQSIHWPIGLPIKSQTPEEIAISIAAEIIQVKNQNAP